MKNNFAKFLLLIVVISLHSFFLKAQNLNLFSIKGLVVDMENIPIEGASIFLINNKKTIKQTLTAADGNFEFKIAKGSYSIVISFIGYTQFNGDTLLITKDVNLGVIKLKTLNKLLDEITVSATKNKPLITINNRKLVYNVSKSITAQGGSALDVLRKTPGVLIGKDNTLTLNGLNGALVLINGKQTYLQPEDLPQFLRTIPSSTLKSVEVIKNPSAEYDAAGSGGIINIVIQKSAIKGFSGSITNGLAYGVSLKQNTDFNFNFRNNKINFFGSYNHAFGSFKMDYNFDRIEGVKTYISPTADLDKRKSIGSSLGVDYELNDKQTIGVVLNGNFLFGPGITNTITKITDNNTNQLIQTLNGLNDYYQQNGNRYNANLNYAYKDSLGNILNFDADYGYFDGGSKNFQPNTYYAPNGEITSENIYNSFNNRHINMYAINGSYQTNLWKGKIKLGAKFSVVDADNNFYFYKTINGNEVMDLNRSNFFSYNEQVTAAFIQYEGNINKSWNYDIGLRVENTHSTGNLIPVEGSTQQKSTVLRNYLNLFPTGSLTFKTEKSGTFGLNYARRIDRPAYKNLNPFDYLLDELTYWKGNPFLQPQYGQSISFQYSYKKTTANLSYTFTDDLSLEIAEIVNQNHVAMVPRNLGAQKNLSLMLTQQLMLTDFWQATLSGSFYYVRNKIETTQFGIYNPKRYAGNISIQQSFKLPYSFRAEISSSYNSKTLSGPNGISKANSQVDLGLQKELLKNKGTIRLSCTDIYKGNKWDTETQYAGFYQRNTFSAEFRQIKLGFTYRFDNKNTKSRQDRESGLGSETQRL